MLIFTALAALFTLNHAQAEPSQVECYLDQFTQAIAPDDTFKAELESMKKNDPSFLPRYLTYPVYNMELTAGEQTYAMKFLQNITFPKNYDSCKSLECLYEMTYTEQMPSASAWADVIPYWYYKTGYAVSTGKRDALFKAEELRGMWILSNIVPQFYKNLPTLDIIKRIPDGYLGDDGSVGTYYQGSRQIVITELSTVIKNYRLLGNFHHTLVHEMAHAFDRSINWGVPNAWFSETSEWLELSKWERQSRNDWKVIDGNFASTYAATAPGEDFAESMAFFILEPDTLKKMSPEKFEFISKKFFNGKKFDTETLTANYQAALTAAAANGESAARAKLADLKRTDYYACGVLTTDVANQLVKKALSR